MNAAEFAQYRNDYASFGSDANHPDIGADTPLSGSAYPDPLSLGEGTDWIKEITRTAIYSNYALSLSGTNEKASYYSSFSYNDTQGIIDDSGQKRFTGRINLERQLFKWLKVGYTGSYTWRHNDQNKATIGGTNWWSGAQYLSPLLKPTDTYNPLYYNGQKINTPRALIDHKHPLPRTSFEQPQLLAQTGTDQELHDQQHLLLLPLPASHVPLLSGHAAHEERKRRRRGIPRRLGREFVLVGDDGRLQVREERPCAGRPRRLLGLPVRVARLQSLGQRLHGRRHHVEQHERCPGQGDLLGRHGLLEKDQDVGLRPSELQLEIALLPHGDRPLRRRLELRGQQQVGILPVGGRQVESGQRELPERLRLDRRPVDSRERRSDRQRRDQHLPFAGRARPPQAAICSTARSLSPSTAAVWIRPT